MVCHAHSHTKRETHTQTHTGTLRIRITLGTPLYTSKVMANQGVSACVQYLRNRPTSPTFRRVTSFRCLSDLRIPYRSGCSAANYNQSTSGKYRNSQNAVINPEIATSKYRALLNHASVSVKPLCQCMWNASSIAT